MMEIKTRNPVYTVDGRIDCEIEHPVYGWIPFTASPDDNEQLGRDVFEQLMAEGDIAPYQPPSENAQLEAWRANAICSRFQAKAALMQMGMLAVVEDAVANADPLAKLAWVEAIEFKRNSPTIQAVSQMLDPPLTDEQLDHLFEVAMQIEA